MQGSNREAFEDMLWMVIEPGASIGGCSIAKLAWAGEGRQDRVAVVRLTIVERGGAGNTVKQAVSDKSVGELASGRQWVPVRLRSGTHTPCTKVQRPLPRLLPATDVFVV